jgi:Lar family restriction alleviation protein
MTTPDLRPCPFCGSDAYFSGEMFVWAVLCHGCEATNGPHKTELKAAVQWNKRAVGAAPADPLDIEELFDAAAGADEETHVRFARLIEAHHGIHAEPKGQS